MVHLQCRVRHHHHNQPGQQTNSGNFESRRTRVPWKGLLFRIPAPGYRHNVCIAASYSGIQSSGGAEFVRVAAIDLCRRRFCDGGDSGHYLPGD